MAVDEHYENFPVASLLIPPSIRPHVVAIYRFARHADDVADEGDAEAPARIAVLDALAGDVRALFAGEAVTAPTVRALAPLRDCAFRGIDAHLFLDLLSAFRQDVSVHQFERYADLLDYCRRSANPVGRLMLALSRVEHPAALAASDDICTALQLINFWQDVAIDRSRGRLYVPLEDVTRFGADVSEFPAHPAHRELMRFECERARELMLAGRALLPHLSGRFRIEIALTMAGGLRILEKIAGNDFDVRRRPTLRWYDSPRLIFLATRCWLESRRALQ